MNIKLSAWFEKITTSQTLSLGGLALLVGLTTGMGVWLFKWLIELVRGFTTSLVHGWMVILPPVIASVRRGGQVFIPRGETRLLAGDVLVVVAEGAARTEAQRLCSRPDGELSP